MWQTSQTVHSGWHVEIMRLLCSLSQTRTQNTEHIGHGATLKRNNWLQNAYAFKQCFTEPNGGCTCSRISGIKYNVPSETTTAPFGILRNKPVHKARWGGLTVEQQRLHATLSLAFAAKLLARSFAANDNSHLLCNPFLFGNGTKDNTKKCTHLGYSRYTCQCNEREPIFLTVHECASHEQASPQAFDAYHSSTRFQHVSQQRQL